MSKFEDYDSASNNYDDQRFAMGVEVAASMIQFHCQRPQQEIHVLDAGCGTGNYAKALLEYGYGHVTMFDGSDGMLEKAKLKLVEEIANGRVTEIRQHLMPTLPYTDSSFDAVMFNHVLHHIDGNADGVHFSGIHATLVEARRVLKPGGVLSISTTFPSEYSPKQWHERLEENIGKRYYKRFPEARQWMAMFDKTGFATISALQVKADQPNHIVKRMYDPEGPTKKEWRDSNSYWAAGTQAEIANVKNKIRKMKENGTLDQFIQDNDKTDKFYDCAFVFAKAV